MIVFSGLSWHVRNSDDVPRGPGPNYFSRDNVFVDEDGRLHLTVTKTRDRWSCAEVIGATSIGYGTYRFYVASAVAALDPNIVVGLFTWSDDPAFNNREIDIEFSRWGDRASASGQFVVQPGTDARNVYRFEQPPDAQSTHSFVWKPDAVDFSSFHGFRIAASNPADLIAQWSRFEGVPVPGGEAPRINFWLVDGREPMNASDAEVVIERVEFVPLT
jgi:hypothetical protein